MRILEVEFFNAIFPVELIKWAKKQSDISFDLLTTDYYQEHLLDDFVDNLEVVKTDFPLPFSNSLLAIPLRAAIIAQRRSRLLNSIGPYDICHIQSLDSLYGLNERSISRCARHLIVTFYGYDIYHTTWLHRLLQKRIIERADIITFTNAKASEYFMKFFGRSYQEKIRIIRFGMMPLEILRKMQDETKAEARRKLGIPEYAVVVACGYNGNPNNQHLDVLKSISTVARSLPDNVFLVVPMTYGGSQQYRTQIQTLLMESQKSYKIFDTFMSDIDVARLRKSTDIMVNVPLTDQFSGSMQEHIYAGNIVINGDWLPYDVLYDNGVFALKASNVKEVGPLLIHAIQHFDELSRRSAKGKDAIWSFSSWEANTPKWIDLYKEVCSARTLV